MHRYSYVAVDLNNRKVKGQYLANNEEHLKNLLSEQDLFLVRSKVLKSTTPNAFFSLSGSVKTKDIAVFCKQFSTMFSAGIEIVEILQTLSTQPYPQMFKMVIQNVLMDVNSGLYLSEAMAKHKKIFPEFFISMIKVGEASGKLDEVFAKLADYYENQMVIKAKLVSALSYPIFLLLMTIGVVAIVTIFIVPRFQDVFSDLGIELPPITQGLFDFTEFIKHNWKTIFVVLVVVIGGIILARRTKKGRFFFDKLRTKLPIISKVVQAGFTARFSRCFSTLLSSGMQVVDALEILGTLLGNKYYEYKIQQATEDVKKGVTLTRAFHKTDVFPAMLLQMVSLGEKTGTLDETLEKVSNIFDQEQKDSIDKATSAIQPILLIIIACFVLIVLLAIFLPMLSITSNLG